jgi:hypothetical protein
VPGPAEYHLFVHLGDPGQAPLAQADSPLMNGTYPSQLWADGEVFDETVSLVLPPDLLPGDYPITIGIYDYETGQRLPVTIPGEGQPGDAFGVGRLTIE